MVLKADNVVQAGGHQYHIACKPGDLAENILFVGDPGRVSKVKEYLSEVRFEKQHREFVSVTGKFKGMDLSVVATGIGQANMEIAMIEICQITKNPTLIRCGSSGALQPDVQVGDLVISMASVRMEQTTSFFVPDGLPAVAHLGVTRALEESAKALACSYHVGITASVCGFYGAQGREIPGFPLRKSNALAELQTANVLNMEMETATLFVLAQLRKVKAGAVCAVYANRQTNEMGDESQRLKAEKKCIEVSLDAFLKLSVS